MPNVNLTDSRSRDAVVKAETTAVDEEVRYVDKKKQIASTRKILKATVDHDFDTLVKSYEGDSEALGKALIESDPEVDMEICGLYLWGVSKVYVDSSDGIVYRIEQQEIVRGPDGAVRETRPRNRPEANVDSEIPLTWTGRNINKQEAVRRFVFASKLQIVHINGLTYDFLYGMAKELSESNSLMMVGGGGKGRDPLIFRSGSIPYRGFLEGRIDGDRYLLLLHLSNLELKVPSVPKSDGKEVEETGGKASAKKEVASKAPVKDAKKPEARKSKTKKSKEKSREESKEGSKDVVEEVTAKKAKAGKKSPAKKEPDKKSAASKSDVAADEAIDSTESRESNKKKSEDPKEAKLDNAKAKETKTESVTGITSEDLGIWLKSIRMGKYLKLFVENEIDVDVLTELTDDDLKELDIPLGSRRRLLKAVEETDNLHAEVASAVKQMTGTSKSATNAAKQKK